MWSVYGGVDGLGEVWEWEWVWLGGVGCVWGGILYGGLWI